ncbi:MAG: RNA polymerase sigma factor [Gammaproteobacteria bacterium]|nr:RNA polymerase sigma factor [Gammaproteobacteria bacterium]NVK88506.1 RNA polymerase sigma factor [Gammaproteobacteria bacterium]
MRAFERLYRLFEKRIYALCFRMSSNSAVAEELMQEAFVLAWRKLDTFKGDSQFGTWLHRLTSNLVISHFRVKKNQEVDSLEFEIPSEYNAPEKLQLGRDLERAVAELPTKARMVLVLHDIEGYKHHEIAQQMDISEGTCKAQLHRARQLLKARFE